MDTTQRHRQAPPRTLSLLFADDDPADRALIATSLREVYPDCFLHVVDSGEEAIKAAAQHPFDCALIDLHLKDIDGLDVAHGLRAQLDQACPALVLLTGRPSSALTSHLERLAIPTLAKTRANLLSLARAIEGSMLRCTTSHPCA